MTESKPKRKLERRVIEEGNLEKMIEVTRNIAIKAIQRSALSRGFCGFNVLRSIAGIEVKLYKAFKEEALSTGISEGNYETAMQSVLKYHPFIRAINDRNFPEDYMRIVYDKEEERRSYTQNCATWVRTGYGDSDVNFYYNGVDRVIGENLWIAKNLKKQNRKLDAFLKKFPEFREGDLIIKDEDTRIRALQEVNKRHIPIVVFPSLKEDIPELEEERPFSLFHDLSKMNYCLLHGFKIFDSMYKEVLEKAITFSPI